MREFLLAAMVVYPCVANSQEITSCSDPKGHGYYANMPPTQEKDAGWVEDGIKGGITTLQRIGKGQYDILFTDSMKRVVSHRQDGANILPMRRDDSEVLFLVYYPESTQLVELYSFFRERRFP